MRYLLFCILLLGSFHLSGQSNFPGLDEILQQVIADSLSPGVALTVFTPDSITYRAYAGVQDWTHNEHVGPYSIFEAASLSKPVFAYLFLQNRRSANLGLRTPVHPIIPIPDLKNDVRTHALTPELLLSHQTGLPNWRGPLQVEATTYEAQFPPSYTLSLKGYPGQQFRYSGEGVLYLQRILETRLEKDLERIAQDELFTPLGMKHATFSNGERFVSGLTQGVNNNGEQRPLMKVRLPVAAASLLTTVDDYTRFLQQLLKNEPVLAEMSEPLVTVDTIGSTRIYWGRGVGITQTPEDSYLFHWGDNGSYKAYFIISLSEKKGLVWFANSSQGLAFRNAIVRQVFDHQIPMWPTDYSQRLE